MSKAYPKLLELLGQVDQCSPNVVGQAMIQMAEDVASGFGQQRLASRIFFNVCDYLHENECWWLLAETRGYGNEIIGIKPDKKLYHKYMHKLPRYQKGAKQ